MRNAHAITNSQPEWLALLLTRVHAPRVCVIAVDPQDRVDLWSCGAEEQRSSELNLSTQIDGNETKRNEMSAWLGDQNQVNAAGEITFR